jgi:alpha-maltose-1-phosphate synthase
LACLDGLFDRPAALQAACKSLLRPSLFADRLIGLERALEDFEIVHCAETYFTFTIQAAAAKKCGRQKLVSTCWETIPFANSGDRLTRWRKTYVQKRIDLFLATSHRAAAALRAEGVGEHRIRVQYPGVDLTHFRPLPRGLSDHGLWRTSDRLRVLFVGRIDVTKGVRELLLATAELVHRHRLSNAVEVGLVGNGNVELLHHLVRLLRLDDTVSYRPGLPYAMMPSLYASADVFVLPSVPTPTWEEQFGMVLAESMACGKAVVSTRSGAIPEVVGDVGTLVPPYDILGLSEAIADLLLNDKRRYALGRHALERACNTFDARLFAERLHTLYEEVSP